MAMTILHGNANPSTLQSRACNRSRRRSGSPGGRGHVHRGDHSTVARVPATNPVMGEVKILKRGEPLTAFFGNSGKEISVEIRDLDLGLGSTNRLGPDPAIVQDQLRFSDPPMVYAELGLFVKSPPPSSVPMPCFLRKVG